MVQKGVGGGGRVVATLPLVFAVLQYFKNTLAIVDSLSCELQDKVNIMSYGAAEGP